MDKPDVDAVPKFVLANKTYRAVLGTSDKPIEKRTPKNSKEAPIGDSTLIVSKTPQGNHKPMIDLDFEVAVLPSSTSGHNHLYINKDLTDSQYEKLLTTMVEVGLVQPGVLQGFKNNKETSLRLPGVKKGGAFEKQVENEFNQPVQVDKFGNYTVTGSNMTLTGADFAAIASDYGPPVNKVSPATKVEIDNLKVQFNSEMLKFGDSMKKFQSQINMLQSEMNMIHTKIAALDKQVNDAKYKGVDKTDPTW